MWETVDIFVHPLQLYAQKVLCSEGPMLRRFYLRMVLCSEGPMFRTFAGVYAQNVLCSEGSIFYT